MRLIDADDLIKILEENNQKLEEQIKDARTEVQKVVYEAQLFTAKEIVEVIKEQPTAYNVDKVVEHLEDELRYICLIEGLDYKEFREAFDVVKEGGKDE